MKKILILIAAVGLATPSFAIVVDFNSIAGGTVISGAGAVTTDFTISGVAPGNPTVRATNGPNSTIGGLQDSTRTGYRIDFNVGGVNFVSVDIGDFNQDSENIYLQAYSFSNVLLGSDTFALPGPQNTYQTLSVGAGNISYILFGGGAGSAGGVNSVLFDNVSYDVVSGVPDGGANIAMLGLALAGMIGFRRKFAA